MRRRAVLPSLFFVLVLGCGETNPVADLSGGGSGPDTEEAMAFLTRDLTAAFDSLDAVAYETLLHPDFRYVFLEDETPAEYPAGFWGKTTEVAVMTAAFSDPGIAGANLQISLFDSAAVTSGRVPGTDDVWYWRATSTLTEISFHTAGTDSTEPATYYAFTKMGYELRVDLAGDGVWRLYEQTECPPIFGEGPAKAGWGAIKTLFYSPLDAPAMRTVKGAVHDDTGAALADAVVSIDGDTVLTDAFGRFVFAGVDGEATEITIEGSGVIRQSVPIGGGDEVYRVAVDLETFALQERPDDILAELAAAYSTGDSARYARSLDFGYRFDLRPEEIDPDAPEPRWDREIELAIAGRMFHGKANDDGQTVLSLSLDLNSLGYDVDTLSADVPSGETRYLVEAQVYLDALVRDPLDPEGSLHFEIRGEQSFVVRPDPENASRYLVIRQIDRTGDFKASAEGSSWTALKTLWR